MQRSLNFLVVFAAISLLEACAGGGSSNVLPSPDPGKVGKIKHVVIIFQENWTPDNLFHNLPGADIASVGVNSHGQTVPLVPISLNGPYDIDHSHKAFLESYNDGRQNGWDLEKFGCPSHHCGTETPFGYVPTAEVKPYFALAEQYTFADRMFQTNEGPSFPAHQYIIAGTSTNATGSSLLASENPRYADRGRLDCGGSPLTLVQMIDPSGSEATLLPPCFDHQTLFDLLDARQLSWRYYDAMSFGGLWSGPDAIAHIRFGPDWTNVVSPGARILSDISAGQLPAVSWVIPTAAASDHASITDGSGPDWVASFVNAVGKSQYWSSTAIFITWDDWGGWYDHVPPHVIGSYELGFRVPLIVVSPYARRGYVSHVPHEFGSILHFTEATFGLGSLGYSDARSDDLSDCFNFGQAPTPFQPIPTTRFPSEFMVQPATADPPDDDF